MITLDDDYNKPQPTLSGFICYKDGTRWTLRYEWVDVPVEWKSKPPPTYHYSNQRRQRWRVA